MRLQSTVGCGLDVVPDKLLRECHTCRRGVSTSNSDNRNIGVGSGFMDGEGFPIKFYDVRPNLLSLIR